MLLQRLRKAVAPFDPRAHVLNGVAHDLIRGLLDQSLQGLHHGQTGVDHGRQLTGKNHQIRERHLASGCLAFPAHLFLN